jgi:hypothetical protein
MNWARCGFGVKAGGRPIPFYMPSFLASDCIAMSTRLGSMRLLHGASSGGIRTMKLIAFYVGFVVAGEAIAYVIGRTVEQWSPTMSLPVFLACFFFTFWGAWRLAVRLT